MSENSQSGSASSFEFADGFGLPEDFVIPSDVEDVIVGPGHVAFLTSTGIVQASIARTDEA